MRIERSWNPIVMKDDVLFTNVVESVTPNDLIKEHNLAFVRKVVLLVETEDYGGYWSTKDWDCIIPFNASVRFIELPAGSGGGGGSNPLQVIATIAIIAISVWFPPAIGLTGFMGAFASAAIMIGGSLLLNMFFGNNNLPSSDYETGKSVYSINAGGNNLRIGQPFAEWFGRQKRYPDLIQLSYSRIENNEQYMYFFMCLGVGDYDVEGVFLAETPILEYEDASYNILPPGIGTPSICSTSVVWTCMEVRGQELDPTGVVVVASGRGTAAQYLEYDLQFPALVRYNDEGDKKSVSVTVTAKARLVDDYGDPISGWVPFHTRKYTDKTAEVKRFSNKCPVPLGPGRYEVNIYRTNETSTDSKKSDKVFLIGLRSYGQKHINYGDVTCIEGRVRATDRLNGDVTNKISVVATRKLYPVTEVGFGGAKVKTESIVDAIAYILTSPNGGRQSPDFLKWDVLGILKEQVDGLGHGFSYIFSSQTNVMDACQKAGQTSRLIPVLPGGQFCLARDQLQTVPAVTYTEDDYDEGSFKINYNMVTPDAPTCVKINYVDSNKWLDDYVVYYDERGSEDRPYEIDLEGCIYRQQAYDLAVYLYRDLFNNVMNIEFTTGLKGHIPSLFRKIALSATYVDWSSSGRIVAVNETDGKIYLSEPVDFGTDVEGYLFVTRTTGASEGPFLVTPTADPYVVNGSILNLLTLKDDDVAATSYLFGPINTEPLYIRLMGIVPLERGKIRLVGTVVDDSLYSEIPSAPVPLPYNDIGVPLMSVSLVRIDDTACWGSWAGDATEYRVEVDTGSGYSIVSDAYEGKTYSINTSAQNVSLRVTPYQNGVLSSLYAEAVSVITIPAPTGLAVSVLPSEIVATWNEVAGAEGYDVDIWVGGIEMTGVFTDTATLSTTTASLAPIGGPWPSFEVRVQALVSGQLSLPATLDVAAPVLSAPSGLAMQSILSNGILLSWNTVSGATGYKVYVGTTAGFDPATTGTLVYEGTNPSGVAVVSVATPYNHYFKVAATSAYYQDVADLTFSAALNVVG